MYAIRDVLGDEGRKLLDACVKVKIFGLPENIAKYCWDEAWELIEKCYADWPSTSPFRFLNPDFKRLVLPKGTDKVPSDKEICSIIDIQSVIVQLDNMLYVEKYPKPGRPGSDEVRKLIDERRANIEREYEKAIADPDARNRYSWLVAQRRVRDCFAGNFAGDVEFLRTWKGDANALYDIFEIYDTVEYFHKAIFYDDPPLSLKHQRFTLKRLDFHNSSERQNIERELKEADSNPDKLSKHSEYEAALRVRMCYEWWDTRVEIFPTKVDESGLSEGSQTYNIFDIQREVQRFDEKAFQQYPESEETGSDEIKESIEKSHSEVLKEYEETKRGLRRYSQSDAEKWVRDCFLDNWPEDGELFCRESSIDQTYDIFDISKVLDLFDRKERQQKKETTRDLIILPSGSIEPNLKQVYRNVQNNRNAISREVVETKCRLGKYSRGEAERRARGCFVGAFADDTELFAFKEKGEGQTYDIFDIKNAVDCFDVKKLFNKHINKKDSDSQVMNNSADETRAEIKEEYTEATTKIEIEHGSGFIVHDHFVITNGHVIQDAVTDKTKEICIFNSYIDDLPCEVDACTDSVRDLALLYCPQLDIKECGITPLHLSNVPLLPGMKVFSFGYPMSHTGETALFVNGHVSGSKAVYSDHCPSLTVLNLSLNAGNSGGPILCWIANQLKVVGVATQKHFKQILTFKEMEKIEEICESLQTSSISKISDDAIKKTSKSHQIPISLLTLKLYDALESHSQFNLSNAIPAHCVIEFIKEFASNF